MRSFTEQEKWILRKTAEIKKNNATHAISLYDICVTFLTNEYIHYDYHKPTNTYILEYFFDSKCYQLKDYKAIEDKKKEIEKNIIDTIFLLKFLKENRLLFEINENKESETIDISRSNYNKANHLRIKSDFDKNTSRFILDLLVNKQYFIRQEFIDFVNKGFYTEDELHFKKSQRATYISIAVALLIGVGSIMLSVIGSYETDKNGEQQIYCLDSVVDKLKDNQIDGFKRDSLLFDSLYTDIEKIIEQIKLNKPIQKIDAFITNFPDEKHSTEN